MGMIGSLFAMLFGNGRNVVKDTVEVFRENAEAGATREITLQAATLSQFAAEFAQPRVGLFDRLIDGLNRIPRPALAFGTLSLFIAAMVDPVWFASRMQGIALVPEPLWWLLGAIVSFYFGARHQAKGQDFQRSIADTVARTRVVQDNIQSLEAMQRGASGAPARPATGENPALADWKAQ